MLRLSLTRSALVHVLGRCLQRCLGTLLWHWLRLEWDAFSFWTRSKVVLAAVRRHAAVALAAARIAAAMLGLALMRSALVHFLGRCLQRCLGTQRWHWLRLEWPQRCSGWR